MGLDIAGLLGVGRTLQRAAHAGHRPLSHHRALGTSAPAVQAAYCCRRPPYWSTSIAGAPDRGSRSRTRRSCAR